MCKPFKGRELNLFHIPLYFFIISKVSGTFIGGISYIHGYLLNEQTDSSLYLYFVIVTVNTFNMDFIQMLDKFGRVIIKQCQLFL